MVRELSTRMALSYTGHQRERHVEQGTPPFIQGMGGGGVGNAGPTLSLQYDILYGCGIATRLQVLCGRLQGGCCTSALCFAVWRILYGCGIVVLVAAASQIVQSLRIVVARKESNGSRARFERAPRPNTRQCGVKHVHAKSVVATGGPCTKKASQVAANVARAGRPTGASESERPVHAGGPPARRAAAAALGDAACRCVRVRAGEC